MSSATHLSIVVSYNCKLQFKSYYRSSILTQRNSVRHLLKYFLPIVSVSFIFHLPTFFQTKNIGGILAKLMLHNIQNNNTQHNDIQHNRLDLMRLCHPPDGSTSPKYKLLCFITTKQICKEEECTSFKPG
jgi:hypothetical protein